MAGIRRPSITLLCLCYLHTIRIASTSLEGFQGHSEDQVVTIQQQLPQHHHQQRQQTVVGEEEEEEVPQFVVCAGKLFAVKMNVLTQVTDNHQVHFKDLPSWLLYDEKLQTLTGVPTPQHLGRWSFTITLSCPLPGPVATCQPTEHVITVFVLSLSEHSNDDLLSSAQMPSSGSHESVIQPTESTVSYLNDGSDGVGTSSSLSSAHDQPGVSNMSDQSSQGPHLLTPQKELEPRHSTAPHHKETKQCSNHYVASLVLCPTPDMLDSPQRVHVMQKAAEFLSIPADTLTWQTSIDNKLHFLDKGYRVESGGASEQNNCTDSVNSELFWPLSCSAGRHVSEFIRILQHNVLVGRIGKEVGAEVVGWYVASKEPKLGHRRRRRRVGSRTPIPTPVMYPSSATVVSSSSALPPKVEFTSAISSSDVDTVSVEPTPSMAEQVTATAVVFDEDQASATVDVIFPSTSDVHDVLTRTYPAELFPSTLQPSLSDSSAQIFLHPALPLTPTPALPSVAITQGSHAHSSSIKKPSETVPLPASASLSQSQSQETDSQFGVSVYPSVIDTSPSLSQESVHAVGSTSVSQRLSQSFAPSPSPSSSAQNVLPFMPAEMDHHEVHDSDLLTPSPEISEMFTSDTRSVEPVDTITSSSSSSSSFSSSCSSSSAFDGQDTSTKLLELPETRSVPSIMTRTVLITDSFYSSRSAVDSLSNSGVFPVPSQTSTPQLSHDHSDTYKPDGSVSAESMGTGIIQTDLLLSPSLTMQASVVESVAFSLSPSRMPTTLGSFPSSEVASVTGVLYIPQGTIGIGFSHTDELMTQLAVPTRSAGPESSVVIAKGSVYTTSQSLTPSMGVQPSETLSIGDVTPLFSDRGVWDSAAVSPVIARTSESSLTVVTSSSDTKEMGPPSTSKYGTIAASSSPGSKTSEQTMHILSVEASTTVGITMETTRTGGTSSSVAATVPFVSNAHVFTSGPIATASTLSASSIPSSSVIPVPSTSAMDTMTLAPTAMFTSYSSAPPGTTSYPGTTSSTSAMDTMTLAPTAMFTSYSSAPPGTTSYPGTTSSTSAMDTMTLAPTAMFTSYSSAPPGTTSYPGTTSSTSTTAMTTAATTTTTTSATSSTTAWWWTSRSSSTTTTTIEPTSTATTPIHIDTPNNPPFLVNALSYMTAGLGCYFERQIPADMFYDVEDGSTRSLSLILTLPYDHPLPPNFWVQFDQSRQMLTGLPLVADLDMGYHSVVVVATDSKGLGARNPINLYVNSSAFVHFTHRFVMKFGVEFGQFMHHRENVMTLLKKLGTYFGDDSAEFVTVVDVSTGSFVLSWTNSSLSGNTCENKTVHALLNRMVRRDGSIRSAFNRHIGKKLKLMEITYQPDGACLYRPAPPTTATNTIATDAAASGHAESDLLTEIILPVLIALLLVLLLVIIGLFVYRCRHQRGSMETLDKDLYAADRSPVILPNELPPVDAYNTRPKKPVLLPYDQDRHTSSFPRDRPRTYEHYRQSGSLSRNRPNSYTFDDDHRHDHRHARPVTVIFNNFDSVPRHSRPPSYWNDQNEETPPNIRVPPPYISTTSV